MSKDSLTQEEAEKLKKELYYDPWPDCPEDGCEVCDKENCGQRQEPEDLCDYNGEECMNSFLHHHCGCVGCEVITPETDDQAKEIQEWAEREASSLMLKKGTEEK
jgi:hypothetical protein